MASLIYWKLRAHISFSTVTFDGHFVSVGEAKRLISTKATLPFEELVLQNPQTSSVYRDDSEQLPTNTSVIVRRVPVGAQRGHRALVGVTQASGGGQGPAQGPPPAGNAQPNQQGQQNQQGQGQQQQNASQEDEFGANPILEQAQALKAQQLAAQQAGNAAAMQQRDEAGRGGRGGFGGGGRGGVGGRGKERPQQWYLCPRCNTQGKHWESECPTKDDPAFDVKRVRPPSGIPKGRIVTNPEGNFMLPNGTLGEIATNSAGFAKYAAQISGTNVEKPIALPAPAQLLAIEAAPAAASSNAGVLSIGPAPSTLPQSTQQPSQAMSVQMPPIMAASAPSMALSQPVQQPTAPQLPTQQPPQSLSQQPQSAPSRPTSQQPQQATQQAALQPTTQPASPAPSRASPAPTTAVVASTSSHSRNPSPEPASDNQGASAVDAPGLFDDDEDVLQAAAQRVTLVTADAVPTVSSTTAAAATTTTATATSVEDAQMAKIESERASIPTDLRRRLFASSQEFLDQMPLLMSYNLLPRAPVLTLVRAFAAGPLTPTEWAALQEDYKVSSSKANESNGVPRSSKHRISHRSSKDGSGADREREYERGRERERDRERDREHERAKEHERARERDRERERDRDRERERSNKERKVARELARERELVREQLREREHRDRERVRDNSEHRRSRSKTGSASPVQLRKRSPMDVDDLLEDEDEDHVAPVVQRSSGGVRGSRGSGVEEQQVQPSRGTPSPSPARSLSQPSGQQQEALVPYLSASASLHSKGSEHVVEEAMPHANGVVEASSAPSVDADVKKEKRKKHKKDKKHSKKHSKSRDRSREGRESRKSRDKSRTQKVKQGEDEGRARRGRRSRSADSSASDRSVSPSPEPRESSKVRGSRKSKIKEVVLPSKIKVMKVKSPLASPRAKEVVTDNKTDKPPKSKRPVRGQDGAHKILSSAMQTAGLTSAPSRKRHSVIVAPVPVPSRHGRMGRDEDSGAAAGDRDNEGAGRWQHDKYAHEVEQQEEEVAPSKPSKRRAH